MNRISTHVLDTNLGKPAQDVSVHLDRQDPDGEWLQLNSSRTDTDGRCNQLLPDNEVLRAGIYRLRFDIASYHIDHDSKGFYPAVEIIFQVLEGESRVHIPLLLSPNGYTTYRGS